MQIDQGRAGDRSARASFAPPAPAAPPPRPGRREEALSSRLFRLASPRLEPMRQPRPPHHLRPYEAVEIPRTRGRGVLSASWYPAPGAARGVVLLLHPWMVWGKAYFHRRGRISALRDAGYHALAVDLPGFGDSGPPDGFIDLDVEDALADARRRAGGLPLGLWGVSSGGYWAHPVLSRGAGRVAAAVFEDVSPHLFEWGWRETPWFAPCFAFFRLVFPTSYRWLDLRRHAPRLGAPAVAYVAGDADPGIPAADTRALGAAAGAELLLVPGAGHLESIKRARGEVVGLALETLRSGFDGEA